MAAALIPEPVITCPDCGGRAHVLGHPPDEGWAPGDVVPYRCEDCADRWDVVLEERDEDCDEERDDERR